MASINDFVNANTGKSLDFDGAYGAQCVDLVQFWAQDLGTPTFSGNAINLVNQTHGGAYTWTANNPDNFPAPGDIVVWAANDPAIGTGEFGHVDICVNANTQNLTTFDQNWNTIPAHLVHHNDYTGVVGWLHPVVLDTPAPTPPVIPTPEPNPTPTPDPTPSEPTGQPSGPVPVHTPDPSVPTTPTSPLPSTPAPTVVPGWKTTEFWAHLVVQALNFLIALPTNAIWLRVLGLASAAASFITYNKGRVNLKTLALNILNWQSK